MKTAIKNFWTALLTKLNNKINQWLNATKSRIEITEAGDDTIINFFAMVVRKVLNRALMGAEFDIVSDSTQAEPLKELCEDIQENVYKITANMIAGKTHSECWIVPSFITVGGQQKLVHSYLDGDRICITATKEDGQISECYMILNAVKRNDKIYFLCRRHNLDDKGNLTITFFISDEKANETTANIPEWDSFVNQEIVYQGVNHIGFGRYKSPVNGFGADTVYGVPLNYGCGKIERDLQEAVNNIALEIKASKKMLFPDWSIVKENKDGQGQTLNYAIDDYIYPIKHKAGIDGNLVDEYCPAIRYTDYYSRLNDLLCQYQAQMGVRDLITHSETTGGATATEIKSKNTDNIALEESIRKELHKGNIMTLEADGIYLNIPRDLWDYDEDFKNIYEDEQQTLTNWLTLYNSGAAEIEDIIKYWFPTLSDEEISKKVNRINASKKTNTESAIRSALMM